MALQLTGRDIYIREGCNNCHSQMIRPLRAETERYGHYSVAGESVYDHPFLWGSKRTGPDLARVGARYSDEWHRQHLNQPRDLVPESNMPAYPWLALAAADAALIETKMEALKVSDFNGDFWGVYISVITVASILACAVLLWTLSTRRVAPGRTPNVTGHVWDEDLDE